MSKSVDFLKELRNISESLGEEIFLLPSEEKVLNTLKKKYPNIAKRFKDSKALINFVVDLSSDDVRSVITRYGLKPFQKEITALKKLF